MSTLSSITLDAYFSHAISLIDKSDDGVAWYTTKNRYRDAALEQLHKDGRLLTGIDHESGYRWVMKISKKKRISHVH
jgi:hypothetical protein